MDKCYDSIKPSPNFSYAQSFKDLEREGYIPCALGPIHAYAEVTEVLPDCFASEGVIGAPREVRGMELQLEKSVLAKCGHYGSMLTILDSKSYPYFERWLLSQQFVNREQRKFFVVRRFTVPVKDPIALALGKFEDTKLDVFTLSGFKGVLKPKITQAIKALYTGVIDPKDLKPNDEVLKRVQGAVPHYIDFSIEPPEEDVIILGRAALEIVDNA